MKVLSNSVKETLEIGKSIGRLLNRGDIIALVGELGSGKTTITKGIVKGIGSKKEPNVTSPTFVLVREYDTKIPVFHVDLYRINNEHMLESFGFRDYLGNLGVTIIEWADKFKDYLPKKTIVIKLFTKGPSKKLIEVAEKKHKQ